MESNEATIRSLTQEWAQAIRNKDIEGVMRHYADNLVTFDVMPPLSSTGADAYRKNWQSWFDSFEGKLDVDMRDVQVVAGDDVAFVHCINRIKPVGTKDDHAVRVTVGLRKIKGQWLVVHEHVSVPLGGG